MNKLFITEQEKKYILDLYRKNKLILEEIVDGPYGLKYDTEKNSVITNFKEVFGVDVSNAEMLDDDSILITFDNFNFLKIYFKDVTFEQARIFVNKIKNNELKGDDIYYNTNETKFPEFFNSLRQKGTFTDFTLENPCEFKLYKNKYNFYLVKKGLVFNGMFIPVSKCEGNVIAHVNFYSHLNGSEIVLTNGKKVVDSWEIIDDGQVNFGMRGVIDQTSEQNPFFTKTNVKGNDIGSLYDLVEKNSYIKIGSKGIIVKILQNSLLRLGYDKFNITNNKEACKTNFEMCDGVFGEGTKKAVINYQNQKTNNLKPDGIVGPSTAQSIINNIESIE
jgi:hypothetical protein